MYRNIRLYLIVAALSVSFFLSACGGGGGGSTGGGTNGGTPTPTVTGANKTLSYGYYMSGTSIMLYDQAHPSTAPVTADTGLQDGLIPTAINTGTFDATNKRITDMHALALLYPKNGMIYTLSVLKSGATPTPAQVSNLIVTNGPGDGSGNASSTDICGQPLIMPDLATPGNTTITFKQAGPDKTCSTSDDAIYAFTLSSSPTTTPTDVVAKVGSSNLQWATAINSVSTGALTGFLVYDANSGSILQTDATWNNKQTVVTNINMVGGGWVLPNGNIMYGVALNSDTSNVRLVQYNPGLGPSPTNPDVSNPQLTLPIADKIDLIFDDTHVYIADYTTYKIYRVPINPTVTDATTTVLDESSNTAIVSWSQGSLRLTSGRVLYMKTYNPGSGNHIALGSVVKTASNLTFPTNLVDIEMSMVPGGQQGIGLFPSEKVNLPGSTVFFNKETTASGNQACTINDDSSGLNCTGSLTNDVDWVGFNAGSMSGLGYDIPSVIYQASTTGVNTTFTAYDAANGNALATISTLANVAAGSFQRMANNYNDMLILTVSAQTDVYNVNSVSANSLVRVTNDATGEVMIAPAGQ